MLTKEFKADHPELPWRYMEDMRHVLVHGYYKIDYDTMVQTIVEDLPEIKEKVTIILENLE